MGQFFKRKLALDFRGVRYPSILGPGVKTPLFWLVSLFGFYQLEHKRLHKKRKIKKLVRMGFGFSTQTVIARR
jgi:hypothetical protein